MLRAASMVCWSTLARALETNSRWFVVVARVITMTTAGKPLNQSGSIPGNSPCRKPVTIPSAP